MTRNTIPYAALAIAFALAGCRSDIVDASADLEATTDAAYSLSKVGRPMIWAGGELFRSVATPAALPKKGPFDELYVGDFENHGGQEVGHISDSMPGDQNFNGGRWHVNVVKNGVGSKYASAKSTEDLMAIDPDFEDDFESTDVYFECPLLPYNGSTNPQGPRQ